MTATSTVRRLKRVAIVVAILAVMFGLSIRDVRIDRHNTPHPGVWIVSWSSGGTGVGASGIRIRAIPLELVATGERCCV